MEKQAVFHENELAEIEQLIHAHILSDETLSRKARRLRSLQDSGPVLTAIYHNPILRSFYLRLCARGKTKLIALIAVMRKMLHVLNKLIADPDFILVH